MAVPQIPDYPRFIELNIGHKIFFDQLFKKYPPQISEFTFTNLFSWREAYNYEVSTLSEAILLRSDVGGIKRFMQPIGAKEGAVEVMKRVFEDTRGVFIRISEDVARFFEDSSHFKIEEDIDNWDYLYLASDLIDLPGRRYDGKRNQIKKFKSEHGDYSYSDIKLSDADVILEFEEAWCAIKGCNKVEGLTNERKMIHQLSSRFADFDSLKAGAIKVSGKTRAVIAAEALNVDTLVVHILKADPALPGLYQVMLNDFLRAQAKVFKYVNFEQDLGIAGLRASKQSYHPVEMIKKYSVFFKS